MIDLEKKLGNKITTTTRSNLTPKSIRCSNLDISKLEEFKNKVKDITDADRCADSKAFKLALYVALESSDKAIKSALSKIL